MLGGMQSGAAGTPVCWGGRSHFRKKKKCCLMLSPEAGEGWGWCPCVCASRGKHDPISQQRRPSVRPSVCSPWLLSPCGDSGSQEKLQHPRSWRGTQKGCPSHGGHRPPVPYPACSVHPRAQTLASSGAWGQDPGVPPLRGIVAPPRVAPHPPRGAGRWSGRRRRRRCRSPRPRGPRGG